MPPFAIAGGNPIEYTGPNNPMMTTWHIDEKVQKHVANAYRLLFHGKNSTFDATLQIQQQVHDGKEIQKIVQFLADHSRQVSSQRTYWDNSYLILFSAEEDCLLSVAKQGRCREALPFLL